MDVRDNPISVVFRILSSMTLCLGLIFLCFQLLRPIYEDRATRKQELVDLVDSGYSISCNDNLITRLPDNVLSYEITFDDVKKIIYLEKETRGPTVIPFAVHW